MGISKVLVGKLGGVELPARPPAGGGRAVAQAAAGVAGAAAVAGGVGTLTGGKLPLAGELPGWWENLTSGIAGGGSSSTIKPRKLPQSTDSRRLFEQAWEKEAAKGGAWRDPSWRGRLHALLSSRDDEPLWAGDLQARKRPSDYSLEELKRGYLRYFGGEGSPLESSKSRPSRRQSTADERLRRILETP